jgi:hypothetical protein
MNKRDARTNERTKRNRKVQDFHFCTTRFKTFINKKIKSESRKSTWRVMERELAFLKHFKIGSGHKSSKIGFIL